MNKMKQGEKAEVTIAPEYGYGAEASQHQLATVPPNSTLVYTIELVKLDKVRIPSRRTSSMQRREGMCGGK